MGSSELYFEEPVQAVWHIVRRTPDGRYPALCGWEMTDWHGRIWPMKRDEPGPATDAICRTCLAAST